MRLTAFHLFAPILSAFLLLMFTGCGGGGADSITPENLARETVTAIKAKDLDSYLELCITKAEMLATIDAAIATERISEAQREQYEELKRTIDAAYEKLDVARRSDFKSILDDIDWAAVKIKTVEFEARVRRGIDDGRITIQLDNDKILEIDDVFRTPSGWRIADDRPLRLR